MTPFDEKLAQFAEDQVMFNAVKNVLMDRFDLNVQYDVSLPNEQQREIVRGCLEGRKRLQDGFRKLETFKRMAKGTETLTNPAV